MAKLKDFTPEQKEVIFDDGNNLLVSASAGSGKTTVMIQRIIELLLKYEKDDEPISLSNFLVVTFTKASASDMKKKLIEKLSEREPTPFILSQIEKVSTSDISNLHSFCSRLVTTFFYEVGLDPAAFIIDETQSTFYKNKALDRLFEKKEKEGDEDYLTLYEIFKSGQKDVGFRNAIVSFSDYLRENIDGDKWFYEGLEFSYEEDLDKNMAAKQINISAAASMKMYADEIERFLPICSGVETQNIYDYFVDLQSSLLTVNLKNSFLTNAKNIFDIKVLTVPKPKDEQFMWIKDKADVLQSAISAVVKSFKENFVSNDETVLLERTKNAKNILVKLYNLVKEYSLIYEKIKRDANALDFHDLEHFAIKILQNDDIRKAVQKKYRYVLVDEYQDINAVQEKIISLVSSESNRFMVGDVKQSIYRFRFCDPDIFLDKFDRYSKGEQKSKLIKLNRNFRSDKKILKFVDKVFSGVMTEEFGDYDYEKNSLFVPGDDNLDQPDAVNLCYIRQEEKVAEKKQVSGVYSVENHVPEESEEHKKLMAEANYVAAKIKEIKTSRKDVEYGDFAILVEARNPSVYEFIDLIKENNIPVVSDKKYELSEMNYIQEIINFVKLANNQNNDIALFKVLKSRLFNFSDEELAKIRLKGKTNNYFEVVYSFEEKDDKDLFVKVEKLKTSLEKFEKLAKILQVKEFVKLVIEEFDLKLMSRASEDGEQKVKNLENFVLRLPNVDVFDYVKYYADYSLSKEDECVGNAVKVMTIHKSKGIEFKFVFLINLTKGFNFDSTYSKLLFNKIYGVGFDSYDTIKKVQSSSIAISAIRMMEKRKLIEERQRILYVALTRAVEKLFVVCTEKEKELSEVFPKKAGAFIDWFSPIICEELSGKHNDFVKFETFNESELLSTNEKIKKNLSFDDGEAGRVEWFEYKFDDAKNIPLKNSISKILAANTQDEEYEANYFSDEMKSSADRGTVYHKILQSIDFKDLQNVTLQIEKIFESLSAKEKELASKQVVENIFKLDFFKTIDKNDVILQEREFIAKMPSAMINSNSKDDQFILQGVVDLVVIKENEIYILDYKTGKCHEDKLKKYEIQINAYADVIERAFRKKVSKKIICFVDEQKNIEIWKNTLIY